MKDKQLIINMTANILSFAINLGINFIFTPYLIRTIGKEAYSFFPLANNFIGYVEIISVALNSMASRFITIKIHEKNINDANKYFNSVLTSNIVLSLILVVPASLFVVFIDKILNVPEGIIGDVKCLFAFVFLGMILNILTSVFGVATFTKNRLDLSSRRKIDSNIIKVALLIILFSCFRANVAYIAIANLAVSVFIILTNIHYTNKLMPEVSLNKKYFDLSCVKELLSSGIWNSVNRLSVVLLTGLDILIANIFLSVSAAGEYSIVKTVPNFIQQLVIMLVGVFVPQFTILYAQKRNNEFLDCINQSIKFMGLVMTIPISFLIVFGDTFFCLWVPSENASRLYLLSNLTIIPMIVTGSINTIFNVYTVVNKLKVPALVLLLTGILKTSIVFILIKLTDWGILIIPLTSFCIDLLTNLIFTPIYSARCLNVKWNTFYKAIARGCICSVTMMLVCFLIKFNMNVDSWIELLFAGAVSSIISLGINIFIVFNQKERKTIIENFMGFLPSKKYSN